MKLKIQRSQREAGVLSKNALFCLNARVEFAPDERQSISRYKIQNEIIYNSEAQRRLIEKSEAQRDGSIGGGLKSLATIAFAHTKLHITIGSLERGQYVECKSLEELVSAENALLAACQNLKEYLDTALTFDGREILVDFTNGAPAIVAQAVTPQPMLAAPRAEPVLAVSAVATDSALENAEPSYPIAGVSSWEEELGRQTGQFLRSIFDSPSKIYAAIAFAMLLLFVILRAWSI